MYKNALAIFGGSIVLILVLVAIFAPYVATDDPSAIDIKNALLGPSAGHILGTDQLGRDIFSRIVYGSRVSLSIGLIAVGLAAVIGVILGSLAGYFGGRTDSVIMRFVDIML